MLDRLRKFLAGAVAVTASLALMALPVLAVAEGGAPRTQMILDTSVCDSLTTAGTTLNSVNITYGYDLSSYVGQMVRIKINDNTVAPAAASLTNTSGVGAARFLFLSAAPSNATTASAGTAAGTTGIRIEEGQDPFIFKVKASDDYLLLRHDSGATTAPLSVTILKSAE